MKAELKAKWLAALRSGKYKQSSCALETNGGFCCMGVLCKVMGASTDDGSGLLSDDAYLPVRAALNITDDMMSAPNPRTVMHRLANMNDSDRKSFAAIADWIEANIPAEEA